MATGLPAQPADTTRMYAVVGCSDCSALWIVEGRPETTQCPRCGSRKQVEKLKQFVTTDDADHAREVRASMLATRSGHGDAFANLDDFATMDEYVDEDVVSDDEYLESAGIDTDEVEDSESRTPSTNSTTRPRTRSSTIAPITASPRTTPATPSRSSSGPVRRANPRVGTGPSEAGQRSICGWPSSSVRRRRALPAQRH